MLGEQYKLSLDGSDCVECPTTWEFNLALILLAVVTSLGCVAVFWGTLYIIRNPEFGKRYVTTFIICWSHLQTTAIIGSMDLTWPELLNKVMEYLSFRFMLRLPPQCMYARSESFIFLVVNGKALAVLAILLAACLNRVRVGFWYSGKPVKLEKATARAEDLMAIVFLFTYTIGVQSAFGLVLHFGSDQQRYTGWFIAACLFTVIFGMLFRFLYKVQAYVRALKKHGEDSSETKKRLAQVYILTYRYEHCPRWQFVIWSRQLCLFALALIMDIALEYTSPAMELYYKVAVALAGVLVITIFAIVQLCYKPFYYPFQDAFEQWLLIFSSVLLLLTVVYNALINAGASTDLQQTIEYIMLVLVIISVGMPFVLVIVDERRGARAMTVMEDQIKFVNKDIEDASTEIDEPVRKLLLDGTIKLLKCDWLDDVSNDKYLPRVTDVTSSIIVEGHPVRDFTTRPNGGVRKTLLRAYCDQVRVKPICVKMSLVELDKAMADERIRQASKDVFRAIDKHFETRPGAMNAGLLGLGLERQASASAAGYRPPRLENANHFDDLDRDERAHLQRALAGTSQKSGGVLDCFGCCGESEDPYELRVRQERESSTTRDNDTFTVHTFDNFASEAKDARDRQSKQQLMQNSALAQLSKVANADISCDLSSMEAAVAAAVAVNVPQERIVPFYDMAKRTKANSQQALARIQADLDPARQRLAEALLTRKVRITWRAAISSFLQVAMTKEALESKAESMKRILSSMSAGEFTSLLRTAGLRDAKVIKSDEATISYGNTFLPRCQNMTDLENEHDISCFADPAEAEFLWNQKRRNVYVLSYGWRMGGQPDPDGRTLIAVRRHLRDARDGNGIRQIDLSRQLMFWDAASLPQKDYKFFRSESDDELFKAGLKVMGAFYASVSCTAVLQLQDIPMPEPRPPSSFGGEPAEFVGVLNFFGDFAKAALDPTITLRHLLDAGVLKPEFEGMPLLDYFAAFSYDAIAIERWADRPGAEYASVRFSFAPGLESNFEAFVLALKKNIKAMDFWYNATPYLKRGWPTFETGAAMIVKSVIGDVFEDGNKSGEIAEAERAVPKLTYISDLRSIEYHAQSRSGRSSAKAEIDEVEFKLKNDLVTFTGKGDKDKVLKLLNDFSKTIRDTIDHAEIKQLISELKLTRDEGDKLSAKMKQNEANKMAKLVKDRKLNARLRKANKSKGEVDPNKKRSSPGFFSSSKKINQVHPSSPLA